MPNGCFPEWPNGADCKSAVFRLRWFESISTHSQEKFRGIDCEPNVELDSAEAKLRCRFCGNSSVDRALAFQAGGRGFEPRFPL